MRRVRRTASGDSGVVLAAVLLTAFVMSLLGAALLVYTTKQMPQAAEHQDRQAALAAAEAGIEDYLQRINSDPEYYVKGFADTANPSFQGFVPVPGAQDSTAEYRIDGVDITAVPTRGAIVVSATGRVGQAERSLRVELSRKKFTDYAYLSNLEVNDPRNFAKYPGATTPERIEELEDRCGVYRWQGGQKGRSGYDSCGTLQWYNGDITDGKVHTNDLIGMSGSPRFNDKVESGCSPPGCGTVTDSKYRNYDGSTSAYFKYPGDGNGFGVIAGGIVKFPTSNGALKDQTQPPNSGCLFTGPTRIVLKGTYAEVYSRNSKQTNGSTCGGNYTSKGPNFMATVPMTDAGLVIYVQNVPASSSDPNHTAAGSLYSTAPFIPGAKPNKSPDRYRPNPGSTATVPVPNGFPLPEDKAYTDFGSNPVYGPSHGDVLVEGTLDGRLTIGAEDDIIITSDLLQKDPTGDVLGLVANNFIWNYHPVNGLAKGEQYEMCGGSCMHDVRIEASLMSVKHTYGTTYFQHGASQGTITTRGSIVQYWRNNVGDGTFGTSGHAGYGKRYGYDPQLQFTQPPHFLQPESLVWRVSRWAER